MIGEMTPVRGRRMAGRDGFAQLLRAEWAKFWTVRGWVVALALAAVLTAGVTLALANASSSGGLDTVAAGPGGVAVNDSFYFVHRALAGNGSITVRVTSLTDGAFPGLKEGTVAAQPWAKAGIILKDGTQPGSAYAAVMATPGHGVRMQYDFTHDIAGPASAASPKWLRLSRSGNKLTGYESADGRHWATVGTVSLAGLPATAQAGLFVASPDYDFDTQTFGGGDQGVTGPTQATAVFGHVSRQGNWPAGAWTGGQVGAARTPATVTLHCGASCGPPPQPPGRFRQSGGTVTVAGSGDIAPFVPIVDPLQVSFYGTLFGAIAVIAVGAVFITGEYRRGMIRTTLAASPRRGRVLAAKAIVIGSVTFAAGLAGAAVAFPFVERKLNALSWKPPVWPVWSLTSQVGLRVVVGTAALLAVTALLALAAGAILRRSAGAITAVIGLVIFPLVLAIILPLGPAVWVLEYTPAAAFSLQTSTLRYPQVNTACIPYHGCYPLAPWTGFAVMCAWAVLGLGVAAYLLHRRDA